MKKTYCDKCGRTIKVAACTAQIMNFNSRKETQYNCIDLCLKCSEAFTNWLKGEPIPKQTTKTDYELKHKPNIEGNQK